MFEHAMEGLTLILQWGNILAIVMGLVVGVIIGALPGLSPSMAIALAAPFTFGMAPIASLSFLLGVYKGGVYGGSISAILLCTPGTPEAAATLFDGYPLAKQGRARHALDAALYASIAGDMIGTVLLVFAAPFVAHYALKIGPIEMVPLIVLAMSVIITTLGSEKIKGFIAAAIGALIAMIGVDAVSGSTRFTFDIFELTEGIALIPFLVGLFAVPEIMSVIINAREHNSKLSIQVEVKGDRLKIREILPYWKTVLQSALVGGAIGALPGLGSTAAAFTCYGLAKKSSKNPEKFGNGSIEGVLACETGNNGTCGPALIPLLTLGIPGSSTTAVLYGTLLVHGIVPGPRIFIENGPTIMAMFIGLVIGGLLLYPVAMSIYIYASKAIYKIDRGVLFAAIFLLCFTGAYAINHSMIDVYSMGLAGILGYGMRLFGFPLGPTLIAFILEPILERSFGQAMILSGNNIGSLFTGSIAMFLWGLTLLVVLYGPLKDKLKSKEPSFSGGKEVVLEETR